MPRFAAARIEPARGLIQTALDPTDPPREACLARETLARLWPDGWKTVYDARQVPAMRAADTRLSEAAAAHDREAERVRHRLFRHPELEPEYRRLLAAKHALATAAYKLRSRANRIERAQGGGGGGGPA